MKKSRKMQIIFFSLIPVGLVLLFFSIKNIQKTYYGNIILEIPFTQKSAEFILAKPGNYSIWHKGQFFTKAPLDEFKPEITNKTTGQKVELSSLLLRPNSNNGERARMELFRFTAPSGKYELKLVEGSSILNIENRLINLLSIPMVDFDKYFIQVRENQALVYLLFGIVVIVFAAFCIIGGLVLGILANQIFIS